MNKIKLNFKEKNLKLNIAQIIIALSIFIVIFVSLFLIAFYYDWDISMIMAKPLLKDGKYFSMSIIGGIVEVLGVLIAPFMLSFCLTICFVNSNRLINKINKNWIIFVKILLFLLSAFCLYSGFYPCFKNIDLIFNDPEAIINFGHQTVIIICSCLASVLFALFYIWYLQKKSIDNLYQMLRWSIASIVAIALTMLTILIMKEFIFRPRFRSIYFNENNWNGNDAYYYFVSLSNINSYIPTLSDDWINAGDFNKSFPSGHTSGSSSLYCLMGLPFVLKKYNNKKYVLILWITSVSLVVFVGFTRVLCGAHYTSDVLIAGTIGFCMYIIFHFVFIQTKWFNFLNKKEFN